ncbi:MAG: tetratricopeptide repeat protein [Thiobacillus sp.]|nr:tetratricopeptide repeat protein [Thiobacillus sp.]
MNISAVTPTGLFAYTGAQSAQLESQAQRALTRGLDLFIDQKYDDAIKEFRRAVALAPNSAYAVDAYKQIAQSYAQKNDSQGAIESYQQALRMDPNNAELRTALGNVYYFEERYSDAQVEYERAVRIDPSAVNRFSLGQAYLANGNYTEAELQFKRVQTLEPREPSGSYGLGQVYARQDRTNEAIDAFQQAINVQRDFWDAYVELGYVYADTGRLDEAQDLVEALSDEDATRAATLTAYLYEKNQPKILTVGEDGSFPTSLGRGTMVSALGSYLANAESSQTFSMIFYFSKEMDQDSVEDVFNWTISRSIGSGLGDGYNFNLEIPDTEISLPRHPVGVYYDAAAYTATVYFEIRQNASANGTIDPSHVQFAFSGQDRFGQGISPQADQYAGFSGVA